VDSVSLTLRISSGAANGTVALATMKPVDHNRTNNVEAASAIMPRLWLSKLRLSSFL
jgi:hypothetical protein